MTKEERKYKTFKLFYHNSGSEEIKEIERQIRNNKFLNSDSYNIMKEAKIANRIHQEIKENRSNYSDVMYDYGIILQNMIKLSKELNLYASLELSILFSYLLWYGYLSKNKEYKFKSCDRKIIPGLFFSNIMDGRGVCLNNSEMLKDFLNLFGYNCAMLENQYSLTTKVEHKIDIKTSSEEKEKKKIIQLIEKIYMLGKANHVFNLIEDNSNLYIYDSTNLLLLSIIDMYRSKLINGEGMFKLFPYQSYMLCACPNEIELLDKFINQSVYISLFQNNDLIVINEFILKLLTFSKNLLEDFYMEIKPNIIAISKETDKIVRKKTK